MAEMSGADVNDLPDSAFAYIEPGGKRDSDGRTVPRSLRHYPIHDAAHVRNALSRAAAAVNAGGDQASIARRALPAIKKAARRLGIGDAKAWPEPLKAEPMEGTRLERWLEGKIPRRKLVIPFTGPLPGGKAGLDLDGEYFDEDTDLFGPFPELRRTRERLVDWHHDEMYRRLGEEGDPTGWMKGAILGREVWDERPESAGLWADWWIARGEERKNLIAEIERRGGDIYGSAQAVRGFHKADPVTGHIEMFPVVRDTVTTSPQNTHAVIPTLKALLAADLPYDSVSGPALKAALVGLGSRGLNSGQSSGPAGEGSSAPGGGPGKAGRVLSRKNEADLDEAIRLARRVIDRERARRGLPPYGAENG